MTSSNRADFRTAASKQGQEVVRVCLRHPVTLRTVQSVHSKGHQGSLSPGDSFYRPNGSSPSLPLSGLLEPLEREV